MLERFKLLLSRYEDWSHHPADSDTEYNEGKRISSHHKFFPEFQIELSESSKLEGESFCYFYPNETSYWGKTYFKYHSTILFTREYVFCDEQRILLPVPEIKNLLTNEIGYRFYYYILDNDTGLFFKFLRKNSLNVDSGRGSAPILIFKNLYEFNEFVVLAKNNIERIKSIEPELINPQNFSQIGNRIYKNGIFISQLYQFYQDKYNYSLKALRE